MWKQKTQEHEDDMMRMERDILFGTNYTQIQKTALKIQGEPSFKVNRIQDTVEAFEGSLIKPEAHAIWS